MFWLMFDMLQLVGASEPACFFTNDKTDAYRTVISLKFQSVWITVLRACGLGEPDSKPCCSGVLTTLRALV